MNGYALCVLSLAPGIFWLWYFYKKDRLEPEPKSLVIKTFFWGMIAVIPVFLINLACLAILSSWVSTNPAHFTLAVLAAPLIEEWAKFSVVRFYIYNHTEFDEPMDGIVYAAAAALGFASMENLGYVFSANSGAQAVSSTESIFSAILTVSCVRAFLSVPGHVLFSSMWGFALGAAKFTSDPQRQKAYVNLGLFLAMFLHGVFNLAAGLPLSGFTLLLFLYFAWRMVQQRIAEALRNSPHAQPFPRRITLPD